MFSQSVYGHLSLKRKEEDFRSSNRLLESPGHCHLKRRSVKERKRGAGNPASDFCLKWRPNPNTGHCVEGFMGESREAMKRHFLSAGGRKIKCAALACQKRGRGRGGQERVMRWRKILSAGGEKPHSGNHTHTHTHICSEYQGCLGDIGGSSVRETTSLKKRPSTLYIQLDFKRC